MLLQFLKSIIIVICLISSLGFAGLGLYKAVEYIEDKTYAAKKKIEQIIITIAILHLFLLFRGVNFFLILYSLSIQGTFYTLLESYPNINPGNPTFILGSVMSLGNHFFILRAMILGKHYIIETLFSFVVFVWATPFCFFLSLSANDEALPTKGKKTNTWISSFVKRLTTKNDK